MKRHQFKTSCNTLPRSGRLCAQVDSLGASRGGGGRKRGVGAYFNCFKEGNFNPLHLVECASAQLTIQYTHSLASHSDTGPFMGHDRLSC